MTTRERTRFLDKTKGGRLCVTFRQGADGSLVPETFRGRITRLFMSPRVAGMAFLAAVLPFWFASCRDSRIAGGLETLKGSSKRTSGKESEEKVTGDSSTHPGPPDRSVPGGFHPDDEVKPRP